MSKTPRLKPISQQTILITGASSGIGLATARLAAERGAKVVLVARSEGELGNIAEEIRAKGGQSLAVGADVRSQQDLENARELALSHFGSIDTWVNNAGGSIYGPLLEIPFEEERELFDTNFWGVRHGCRAAVPVLQEGGGAIINIGSEVSERALIYQGLYAASKHAVKAYTDALRMEVEREGWPISVTLVRPTAIDTPFTAHAVNHLPEGEPSLPSPAYDPRVVARAILACAERPHRDVFVGAQSRVASFFESFAPRAFDKVMEKFMVGQQSQGSHKPHLEENEALFHAPAETGQERGGHKGPVLKHSTYTAASLHPFAAASALALGAIVIGSVVQYMGRVKHEDQEPGQRAA
jgi:short-subunit dehydrogenase